MSATSAKHVEGANEQVRVTSAHWIISGVLETRSAAQIGSQESDIADQTFEHDPSGKPRLPGASLAGALRNALNDCLAGVRESETRPDKIEIKRDLAPDDALKEIEKQRHKQQGTAVCAYLFGDLFLHESPAVCFDSVAEDVQHTILRNHVRIDARTGTGEDGKKYDREMTLPGVRFPIRVELLVPGGAKEPELVGALCLSLQVLERGDISFGANKTRGLGACRAGNWKVRRFDLTCKQGWLDYAEFDPLEPFGADHHPSSHIEDAIRDSNFDKFETVLKEIHQLGCSSRVRRLEAVLNLDVESSMLIRAGAGDWRDGEKAPDVRHLREGGKAMVTGTSVAGVLRSECRRILNTLRPTASNEPLLAEMWGAGPEDGAVELPLASRILVAESAIEDSQTILQTRIKIDRFTGGTISGALLEEAPEVGGSVALSIRLDLGAGREHDWMVGLLSLALRELCGGRLVIGGGAVVGRGTVKGHADITALDVKARIGANGCTAEDAKLMTPFVAAMHGKLGSVTGRGGDDGTR